MKKGIILLFLFFLLTSCTYYTGNFLLSLQEVERPQSIQDRYGKYEIVSFTEEGKTKFSYEDSIIKIIWIPLDKEFNFMLENKTDYSIKVIWDEAVYINEKGSCERIIHSETKYLEKSGSQPPSIIVRKTNIYDVIIPSGNINYVSGQFGGWKTTPLFKITAYTQEELKAQRKDYLGKTVSILLPLQIEGVINEYLFKFLIKDFILDSTVNVGI